MHRACEEPNQALICYRRTDSAFAEALRRRLQKHYTIDCFRDEEGHKYGSEWRPCWRQQLDFPVDRTLAADLGPTIIVIATNAACDPRPDGDIVVDEIWEALTPTDPARHNPIVVLQFGNRGWPELRNRLSEKARKMGRPGLMEHLDRLHQPRVFDPSLLTPDLSNRQWNDICRPIVISVRSYFLRKMIEERNATKDWAKDVLRHRLCQDDNFAKFQQSRDALDKAVRTLALSNRKAVVAVAAGGLGKTMQVAQSLLASLDTNATPFFPIVLTNEDIKNLDQTLRQRFGLTWLDAGQPVSLPDEGLEWFLDKLCFVTDSLERADDVAATARQLHRLRPVSKLVVTTRPEAWSKAKDQLAVDAADVIDLSEIGDNDVATYLKLRSVEDVHQRPYLRNPVFLDIAAYLARQQPPEIRFDGSELSNESDLLDKFKAFSSRPQQGRPAPEIDQARRENEKFLESLAQRQLVESRFDVSLSALRADHQSAIDYLTLNRPFAIVTGVEEDKRIRLRHDVIDSHNLAHLIARIEPALFAKVLGIPESRSQGKLHLGFGQVMFEGIVQYAHDRQQWKLIHTFFLEYLRLVDNKDQPDSTFKATGWNCGYVITARFPVFAELIQQSLAGKYLGKSPARSATDRLSDLNGLTQDAMSSVGSMLGGQRSMSIADPTGNFLQSLARHIADPNVSLKGRLIEGVAKVNRPADAVKLLADLASNAAMIKKDAAIVRYIARALQDAARGARCHTPAIQNVLTRLKATWSVSFPEQFPTIQRDIEEAEREVADLAGGPRPQATPFTVAEFIEGLSNLDPTRSAPQFSDWVIVERYLAELKETKGHLAGRSHEAIILAAGRCLWHHHSRCHEKAAHTLGFIDHPFARAILLHVLTFESGDGLETEIIQALSRQASHLVGNAPKRRRFMLALVRAIAVRHRLVGDQRVNELAGLLRLLDPPSKMLITEHYVELQRFRSGVPSMAENVAASPAVLPTWLNEKERQRNVGEDVEAKLAFETNYVNDAGAIRFARSSWRLPRLLHLALRERGKYFKRLAMDQRRPAEFTASWEIEAAARANATNERLRQLTEFFRPGWQAWKDRESLPFVAYLDAIAQLYVAFEGAIEVPSIATLHCTAVLSDGNLIEAQRSSRSDYAPSAWAPSFEEQMKLEDIDAGDGIVTCLLRGFREEFGVTLTRGELSIKSASLGIEWSLINTVMLVFVELKLTSDEFRARSVARERDGEIGEPRFVPLEERLGPLRKSDLGFWFDQDRRLAHPTTSARLALIIETQQAQ